MYTSFHNVIGGTIMLTSPCPFLGAVGAFVSHFVFDYIGEAGYGSNKRTAAFEIPMLLVFSLSALLFGDFWLIMIGGFLANLPDVIDKPRKIFLGKESWFSCHNGEGSFRYKDFKLGYPVQIKLNKKQTEVINISSIIIFLIASLV